MNKDICYKPTTAVCEICGRVRDSDIIVVVEGIGLEGDRFECSICRSKKGKTSKVNDKLILV